MSWGLQDTYYAVASVSGFVATLISITLYIRSGPDRLKTKIGEAMAPFEQQLKHLRDRLTAHEENARRQQVSAKALETEIYDRIEQLDAKADVRGEKLERLATQVEHGVKKEDIGKIHGRIDDILKVVSAGNAATQIHGHQLERITAFLMNGGNQR